MNKYIWKLVLPWSFCNIAIVFLFVLHSEHPKSIYPSVIAVLLITGCFSLTLSIIETICRESVKKAIDDVTMHISDYMKTEQHKEKELADITVDKPIKIVEGFTATPYRTNKDLP